MISVSRLDVSAEASAGTVSPDRAFMSAIRTTITTWRSTADRHRVERRSQRQLERELAEYRTVSERRELDAMLSRHTAEEIAPIEQILNRQARARVLASNR